MFPLLRRSGKEQVPGLSVVLPVLVCFGSWFRVSYRARESTKSEASGVATPVTSTPSRSSSLQFIQ